MRKLEKIFVVGLMVLMITNMLVVIQTPSVLASPSTFGYETAGSNWQNMYVIVGSVFTCTSSGTVNYIKAYLKASPANYFATAIYRHDNNSLVENSGLVYVSTEGWYQFNFTSTSIVANTEYVLVVACEGGEEGTIFIAYNSGTTNQGHISEQGFPPFPNPANFAHNNNEYSIYCDYTPSGTPVGTPHSTIYIENDDFFTPENGVNGGGSGTAGDPYIIENWAIDVSGADGIYIQNTTAYFIVRNCLIENGGEEFVGIYLDNVINGRIENNFCLNNGGILLYSSSYDNLTNNTCENNIFGITLSNSSYNNLINNTCSNNSERGIVLIRSDSNILYNNICSNNPNYGISLYNSSYDNLINNICSNSIYGIYPDSTSSNNTYTNNHLHNNTWAVSPVPDNAPICAITSPSNGFNAEVNVGMLFTSSYSDADGNSVTYLWDFGNNVTSTSENQLHQYGTTGDYTVTLTVNDGYMNSTVASIIVVVGAVEVVPSGEGGGGGGWIEQAIKTVADIVNPTKNLLFVRILWLPLGAWLLALAALAWIKDQHGILYSVIMTIAFLVPFGANI